MNGPLSACWRFAIATCLFALLSTLLLPKSAFADEPKFTPAQQAKLDAEKKLQDEMLQLYNNHKYADAVAVAKKIVAIRQEVLGSTNTRTATAYFNLTFMVKATGDQEAIKTAYVQLIAANKAAYGEKHAETADSINKLGVVLLNVHENKAAQQCFEQALSIRQAVLGPKHADTLQSLDNLAVAHRSQGNTAAAKPVMEQSLALHEEAFGPKSAETAESLSKLGSLLQDMGDYAAAKPRFVRALAIRKEVLGPKHLQTLTSMDDVGNVLKNMADYPTAKSYLESSLALRQEVFGPKHLETANALESLAMLRKEMGDLAAAKPLYEQTLAIRQVKLGLKHQYTGNAMNNLAVLLVEMADYPAAKDYLEQVLALWTETLGPKHSSTLSAMDNLGSVLAQMGDYEAGKKLMLQALALRKETLGLKHPDTATSLYNMGFIYTKMGDFAAAKPFYEEALKIRVELFGPKHPAVAIVLNDLGRLLQNMADYSAARQYFERALAIRRQALGPKHPDTAFTINSLGVLYLDLGDYDAAKTNFLAGYDIRNEVLGPKHPDTAQARANLAVALCYLQQYDAAKTYLEQSLAVEIEALGPKHPDVATADENLGEVIKALGQFDAAKPYFVKALAIREETQGPYHPDTTKSLMHLITLEAAIGDWKDAGKHTLDARQAVRKHVASVLPSLQPQQQIQFVESTDQSPFFRSLSLGLHADKHPPLAALSAEFLVNGKAVIQESLSQRAMLSLGASDPAIRELINQLNLTRTQLAEMAQVVPKPNVAAEYREKFDSLRNQESELSAKVNAALGRSAQSGAWVSLDSIRRNLPKIAVLVDIARFQPFNFQANNKQVKFAPARYVAWITPAAGAGDVQVIDLGEAGRIDAAVQNFQTAFKPCQSTDKTKNPVYSLGESAAESQLQTSLAMLSKLVLHPLLPQLKDKQEIMLSPDASLWLVPWAALLDGDGRYAVENWNIHLLTSARDLVNEHQKPSKNPPIVFANPNYNLPVEEIAKALAGSRDAKNLKPIADAMASTESYGFRAASMSTFGAVPPLPGSAAEANAILPNLKTFAGEVPKLYTDEIALEGLFKRIDAPRVLVLSTHGFFLADQPVKLDDKDNFTVAEGARHNARAAVDTTGVQIENPLLRCGLLFAACNNRDKIPANSNLDDGVLTGMEIVGSDLRGTEMVVLSACETGLGKVSNGEGVAGLRQAFQLAGAQSVVSTLWQIPDVQSAQLMNDFFANLAAGQSKSDALRNAQLKRIKVRREKYGAAHPLFWAAFTLTGQ